MAERTCAQDIVFYSIVALTAGVLGILSCKGLDDAWGNQEDPVPLVENNPSPEVLYGNYEEYWPDVKTPIY